MRLGALVAVEIAGLRPLGQHVLGQRQHDRTRPAGGGDVEGTADIFRNARRIVDLRHPLGHLAEHAAIVEFLERFAVEHLAADLADQQDHRGAVLHGDMHAGCWHWSRPARG